MQFSGKMDILATLEVQKCHFEVSSSAFSHIYFLMQGYHFTVKLTSVDVW